MAASIGCYLTDWRSASPDMRYLSIDSYLGDLNVAVDEIGAPVDLVGLCQGGWLSLLYAARFPAKVRRLVLVGAPVDLSIDSALSRLARNAPEVVYDQLVRARRRQCQRRGDAALLVEGAEPRRHRGGIAEGSLGRGGRGTARAFRSLEYRDAQSARHLLSADRQPDLPGEPDRRRQLRRRSAATVDLRDVKAPVFLLAGLDDDVVPAAQALATAGLLGTPPAFIAAASEPSNHLGLFMGARTHAHAWPRIAEWLRDDLSGVLARSA